MLDARLSTLRCAMCCARSRGAAANTFRVSPRGEQGQAPNTKPGEGHARGGTTPMRLEGLDDARTGMPHGIPRGAMCVQRFDDSLNSAIHTTYRISLRSSSMPEPRDPLLKVVRFGLFQFFNAYTGLYNVPGGRQTAARKQQIVQ